MLHKHINLSMVHSNPLNNSKAHHSTSLLTMVALLKVDPHSGQALLKITNNLLIVEVVVVAALTTVVVVPKPL